MPTIKAEITKLKCNDNLNEHVCVIVWSIDDVLERAYAKKVKISEKEAEEILDKMEYNHDASVGISWDTIDIYISDVELERKEQKAKENEKEKVGFT